MKEAIIGGAIVGVVVAIFAFVFSLQPNQEDVSKTIAKYGCKPTNEFVGKYAERLWICNNGVAYPENVFRSWAYEEKNK